MLTYLPDRVKQAGTGMEKDFIQCRVSVLPKILIDYLNYP